VRTQRLVRATNLPESAVTPAAWLCDRRSALLAAAVALTGTAAPARGAADALEAAARNAAHEAPTALEDLTSYNNYYEFSSDKKAVRFLARALTLRPWTVRVDGEVENPFTLDVDALPRLFGSEERIYRLRCVEGWSMVIPWSGFALSALLLRARPTSRARYVEFESLQRSSEMLGQRSANLPWPYREALRIDEAMHPLCFAVTGVYGQPLPAQNGAPLRLAVPWKYGFKSPKAIVHIRLSDTQPHTSWNQLAPSEYGFYGNVDPQQAHPRWSQARESRIGELSKRATLPLNGYAPWVASLYAGQDPKTLY